MVAGHIYCILYIIRQRNICGYTVCASWHEFLIDFLCSLMVLCRENPQDASTRLKTVQTAAGPLLSKS